MQTHMKIKPLRENLYGFMVKFLYVKLSGYIMFIGWSQGWDREM